MEAAPTVTSSNTSVATVSYASKDSRGYLYDIKTVGAGSATITVSVDGKTATLPVTVTGGSNGGSSSNVSLTLDTKSYTNTAGKSYRFLAKVSGGSGAVPTVTSSNTSVATVSYASKDSRGYLYDIKTVGAGSATITVSVDGKTATLPVTVTDTVDGSVGNLVDPVSKKKVKSAVTTTGLNLRTGPGTTYDRIATLDSNITLTPLDFTSNGWLKSKDSQLSGWLRQYGIFDLYFCRWQYDCGSNYPQPFSELHFDQYSTRQDLVYDCYAIW